jgi:hypothetical protein
VWQPYSYLITRAFSHTGARIIQCEYEKTLLSDLLSRLSPSLELHPHYGHMIGGDKVEVILDKYGGKATNRITHRL